MQSNKLPYQSEIDVETSKRVLELYNNHTEINDLWEIYGKSIGFTASGESFQESGKASFKRRLGDIKESLCGDPRVRYFLEDPLVCNTVDLALIFTGKLLADDFGGVDVAAIAVLVSKIGLIKICQDTWNE